MRNFRHLHFYTVLRQILVSLILQCFVLMFALSSPSYAAVTLEVAYGKLSLIDLGVFIKNEVLVFDESLIRVYALSGFNNENNKTVIAVQGLKPYGDTDLIVNTESGIYQFHVTLDPEQRNDIIMNPYHSSVVIFDKVFQTRTGRLTLVSLGSHINEYVLAGNPNLVSLRQIVADNDNQFLKTFALIMNGYADSTDIVVAAKSGVYKFTVDIKEGVNDTHTENISLQKHAI